MKLEAIREDRTRGGRSTYQCSYTLPMLSPSLVDGTLLISNNRTKSANQQDGSAGINSASNQQTIPTLLQVRAFLNTFLCFPSLLAFQIQVHKN